MDAAPPPSQIAAGFVETERSDVAALYCSAFARKLRPAFADHETGLAVIRRALRPERLLVARQSSAVVGVCGFTLEGRGALDLGWRNLRGLLTRASAAWASIVLAPLARADSDDALVLDGLCVVERARGLGIGTALLQAADREADRRGARAVRLTVVDSNPRARALYERLGFRVVSSGRLGPLRSLYGFDAFTTMQRRVSA